MIDNVKKLFRRLDPLDHGAGALEADETQLAAAALLVHAAMIDGETDQTEQNQLRDLLRDQYKLDEEAIHTLMRAAENEDREAIDLFSFTSVLTRTLNDEGRLRIIEMLWELAYADGVLHEFEDNLIWRVAELMHVPARDRMIMKKRVAEKRSA